MTVTCGPPAGGMDTFSPVAGCLHLRFEFRLWVCCHLIRLAPETPSLVRLVPVNRHHVQDLPRGVSLELYSDVPSEEGWSRSSKLPPCSSIGWKWRRG
jgi:hypothetical protein